METSIKNKIKILVVITILIVGIMSMGKVEAVTSINAYTWNESNLLRNFNRLVA